MHDSNTITQWPKVLATHRLAQRLVILSLISLSYLKLKMAPWDKSTPRCVFDFQLTWFTGVNTLMRRIQRLQVVPSSFSAVMSHLLFKQMQMHSSLSLPWGIVGRNKQKLMHRHEANKADLTVLSGLVFWYWMILVLNDRLFVSVQARWWLQSRVHGTF